MHAAEAKVYQAVQPVLSRLLQKNALLKMFLPKPGKNWLHRQKKYAVLRRVYIVQTEKSVIPALRWSLLNVEKKKDVRNISARCMRQRQKFIRLCLKNGSQAVGMRKYFPFFSDTCRMSGIWQKKCQKHKKKSVRNTRKTWLLFNVMIDWSGEWK